MSSSSEKARSFTQTCSKLFQRLKENGQLGDLMQLDMQHPNGENLRQMSLFPATEKPRVLKSMDLFPEQAGFGDSSVKETEAPKKEGAQMTIFYNGQVVVFDDFPAEKAKEVMMMATKESSFKRDQMTTVFGAQFGRSSISSGAAGPVVTPGSNSFPNFGGSQVTSQQPEAIKPTPIHPVVNDIPMQRKASLQRFLAKRKDRMNNLAPYQMSINGLSSPLKPAADGKSWLGLAALHSQ